MQSRNDDTQSFRAGFAGKAMTPGHPDYDRSRSVWNGVFDAHRHGQSSDAPDPARSYTRPDLADAAVELHENLEVTEAVVLGWSLGGNIGIEMIPRFSGMRGLMIVGTPPVGKSNHARRPT